MLDQSESLALPIPLPLRLNPTLIGVGIVVMGRPTTLLRKRSVDFCTFLLCLATLTVLVGC